MGRSQPISPPSSFGPAATQPTRQPAQPALLLLTARPYLSVATSPPFFFLFSPFSPSSLTRGRRHRKDAAVRPCPLQQMAFTCWERDRAVHPTYHLL
jgi:hypothetical protein